MPAGKGIREQEQNKDGVSLGSSLKDSELLKGDQLKQMKSSGLGANIGEFVGGIVSGTSPAGTAGAVIGTAGLVAGSLLLGAPALVAVGAGAVGFVAGGMAGLCFDLSHHLF
jgi:hypothetical protein